MGFFWVGGRIGRGRGGGIRKRADGWLDSGVCRGSRTSVSAAKVDWAVRVHVRGAKRGWQTNTTGREESAKGGSALGRRPRAAAAARIRARQTHTYTLTRGGAAARAQSYDTNTQSMDINRVGGAAEGSGRGGSVSQALPPATHTRSARRPSISADFAREEGGGCGEKKAARRGRPRRLWPRVRGGLCGCFVEKGTRTAGRACARQRWHIFLCHWEGDLDEGERWQAMKRGSHLPAPGGGYGG
jgi:hypothetical protein